MWLEAKCMQVKEIKQLSKGKYHIAYECLCTVVNGLWPDRTRPTGRLVVPMASSRCNHDMGTFSRLNAETLERVPTSLFGRLGRCSVHGHSFARLYWLSYPVSILYTQQLLLVHFQLVQSDPLWVLKKADWQNLSEYWHCLELEQVTVVQCIMHRYSQVNNLSNLQMHKTSSYFL